MTLVGKILLKRKALTKEGKSQWVPLPHPMATDIPVHLLLKGQRRMKTILLEAHKMRKFIPHL